MIVKAVQGRRSIKVWRICLKDRFEPEVKEWWMLRVVMMTKMSWQVNEEVVSRDMTGKADGMNQELYLGAEANVKRFR